MPGISVRHPGQVLYQTLSMTGLPRNWLRLTCFPSSEVSVKLGATSPICRPTVAPDEEGVVEAAPGRNSPATMKARTPITTTVSTPPGTSVPTPQTNNAVKSLFPHTLPISHPSALRFYDNLPLAPCPPSAFTH